VTLLLLPTPVARTVEEEEYTASFSFVDGKCTSSELFSRRWVCGSSGWLLL